MTPDETGRPDRLTTVRRVVEGNLDEHPELVVERWRALLRSHPVEGMALALRLAAVLRRSGAWAQAEDVARTAVLRSDDIDQKAVLTAHASLAALDRGVPPPDLDDALRLMFSRSDAYLSAGRYRAAARLTDLALSAAFHRTIHTQDLISPLAAGGTDFLQPLHTSQTGQALATASRFRPPKVEKDSERQIRVLVVVDGNLWFIRDLVSDFQARADVDVKTLDLRRPPAGLIRTARSELLEARLRGVNGEEGPASTNGPTADLLGWADVIVVDWCDLAALWVSVHAPESARIVIRLHSVEVLSAEPHTVDWSAVDDLVFVSTPIRRMAEASLLGLNPDSPRIHVVPVRAELAELNQPKRPDASHTMALIGWAQPVKDPLWALDVLSHLRRFDPRWRLLLVGSDFAASQPSGGYRYQLAFEQRATRPDIRDAIVRTGYSTNLGETLPDVGVILSSSVREGQHIGFIQGVASGALPVVRDWPLLKRLDGPRSLFPAEWVVTDPAAAAARIIELTSKEQRRAEVSSARHEVVARYDRDRVSDVFAGLILGGVRPRPSMERALKPTDHGPGFASTPTGARRPEIRLAASSTAQSLMPGDDLPEHRTSFRRRILRRATAEIVSRAPIADRYRVRLTAASVSRFRDPCDTLRIAAQGAKALSAPAEADRFLADRRVLEAASVLADELERESRGQEGGTTHKKHTAHTVSAATTRASLTWALVTAPQGRTRGYRRAPGRRLKVHSRRGPVRLLLAHASPEDWFVRIGRRLGNHPLIDVRYVDMTSLLPRDAMASMAWLVGSRLLSSPEPIVDALRPWARWADVVVVDSCDRWAAIWSLLDPAESRVFVRVREWDLHRPFPILIDRSRVAGFLFPRPDMTPPLLRMAPHLAGSPGYTLGPAWSVSPRPEAPGDRHLIALADAPSGASLAWAHEVLARLEATDHRYQLVVDGDESSRAGVVLIAGDALPEESAVPGLLAGRAVPVVRGSATTQERAAAVPALPVEWISPDADSAASDILQNTSSATTFAASVEAAYTVARRSLSLEHASSSLATLVLNSKT